MPVTANVVVMAVILLTASATRAQSVDESRLAPLVGREVRVLASNGFEYVGKLTDASAGELRLRLKVGEVSVPFGSIERLDKRDSPASGTLIGMVWPVVAFFLGAGQGYDSEGQARAGLLVGIAMGRAIGAALDAANKGWDTVYRADRRGRSGVHITAARGGLQVAWRKSF